MPEHTNQALNRSRRDRLPPYSENGDFRCADNTTERRAPMWAALPRAAGRAALIDGLREQAVAGRGTTGYGR